MTLRPVGGPRPARVWCDDGGAPVAIEVAGRRREVTHVRDDWLVQDGWWNGRPVDRHYHELVVDPGRVVVAFRDAADGRWHVH